MSKIQFYTFIIVKTLHCIIIILNYFPKPSTKISPSKIVYSILFRTSTVFFPKPSAPIPFETNFLHNCWSNYIKNYRYDEQDITHCTYIMYTYDVFIQYIYLRVVQTRDFTLSGVRIYTARGHSPAAQSTWSRVHGSRWSLARVDESFAIAVIFLILL